MRRCSSQPNKEIICQHISLYSRMVLVEEKNLTRDYPIRQISLYMHTQDMMHPSHHEILGLIYCFPFVKHLFLIWYKLYSPENVWRHTGRNPVTLVPCLPLRTLLPVVLPHHFTFLISPYLCFNQNLVVFS